VTNWCDIGAMSRKQTITFTDPQASYLQREARRLGISLADLVRRIIDQYRVKPTIQQD
jgi:hypothetical protein